MIIFWASWTFVGIRTVLWFFPPLIWYFLYLHFKCFLDSLIPPSRKPSMPSSLPLLLWGCSSTHPPTPTSLPTISLHWSIYWAFIGPRTSPPIDAWQGHPLLHMQLEPCVLLGWWLSPWGIWGCMSSSYGVAFPMGLQTPSAPSVLSLTPPLGTPCSVQWLAVSIQLCICKALTGPLRRQAYQAPFKMYFLASTNVSGFGNCIWDESPGRTVSGWPFLHSLLYNLSPYLLLWLFCSPCKKEQKHPHFGLELHVVCELYLGYSELLD